MNTIKDLNINKIFSPDAERSVLGAMLLDLSCIDLVDQAPIISDFYMQKHQDIFRYLSSFDYSDNVIDNIVKLSQQEIDAQYLLDLAKSACSNDSLQAYVDIIKKKAKTRALLSTINDIFEKINQDNTNIDSILDYSQSKIINLANIQEDANKYEDTLYELGQCFADHLISGKSKGISTGFLSLDKIIYGGFKPQEFIILAARPSMGKTALALNIAVNFVNNTNKPIIIFNLDMSKIDIFRRLLSFTGKIEYEYLNQCDTSSPRWTDILDTMESIRNYNIYVNSSPNIDTLTIRLRSRKLYKQYNGIGLIIIDYLQLVSVIGVENQPTLTAALVSKSLKNLSRELDVPIMALSQLNRNPDERIDKRPILSDLRDSGSLEQDADIVMFIYREELYTRHPADIGHTELIISKNRNGPCGMINLDYEAKYCVFKDKKN